MDYTRKLILRSDCWYNDGLRKAQIRDMTGAAASLRRSLKYDRGNVAARNLLGLVYYGVGETGEALVQWIISKNIRPKDNIAAYFVDSLQNSQEELQVIDQAVKRYNKALLYCGQGDWDMAAIELKKAVAEHPSFLKAHQLLSLLRLREGQYRKARESLKAARKLDAANVITLSYMRELNLSHAAKAVQDDEDSGAAESVSAAGTVIRPDWGINRSPAPARAGLKYMAAGAAVAAAVMWFLIFPAVRSRNAQKANRQNIEYSERFNAMEAQISALTRTLDEHRKIFPGAAKNLYENGKALYEAGNYAEAIGPLDKVVEMYEDYEDGKALLILGLSYLKTGDSENAGRCLTRVCELFPGTENADLAKTAAKGIKP